MAEKITKTSLFLELAKPDENGVSRWVETKEFVGKYTPLQLGNGGSYCRGNSTLAKHYIVKFDKNRTPGNSIDAIKLDGFNPNKTFNQNIRKDIRDEISKRNCVMLGVRGFSENTKIEVDHKDGRKDDWRVSDPKTQKLDDFQPLCRAANLIKREICRRCKETDIRWDATNILGNPFPFYLGTEKYTKEIGCVGCYQYDPVRYRQCCFTKILVETLKKFYPDIDINDIIELIKK